MCPLFLNRRSYNIPGKNCLQGLVCYRHGTDDIQNKPSTMLIYFDDFYEIFVYHRLIYINMDMIFKISYKGSSEFVVDYCIIVSLKNL